MTTALPTVPTGNLVHEIPRSAIHPSSHNPRHHFDDTSIDELAQSIREAGLLVPLIVEPDPDEPRHYLIVDGERRYRAAERLGMGLLPCQVRGFKGPEDRVAAMLVTSLQRAELSPLEEAAAFDQLVELGMKQKEIAGRVGRSEAHVSKRRALTNLPASASALVAKGDLTLETAARVAALPKNLQTELLANAARTSTSNDAVSFPDAIETELDRYEASPAGAPKKPKAKPDRAPASAPPVERPAASASTKPKDPDVADPERRAHLRRLIAGDTKPKLAGSNLTVDVARILAVQETDLNIEPPTASLLLDPDIGTAANGSRPADRLNVLLAVLLDGLEYGYRYGMLSDAALARYDRLFATTGYAAA